MHSYFALVRQNGNSSFGIEFPDLPNVFSASDHADSIISDAEEALKLYSQGEDMPTPTSLAVLLADRDLKESLQAGAFLILAQLS